MDVDEITGTVVGTALEIHRELGPGLLEAVYERVLSRLLTEKGLRIEAQKAVSFNFRGIEFSDGFRCDLLVENKVVVEIKSVEKILPVHQEQLQTYLRVMRLQVGLLINFGAATLKEGLQRIVNQHEPASSSPLRINHMKLDRS